jgi:serine/threonine protein kinase
MARYRSPGFGVARAGIAAVLRSGDASFPRPVERPPLSWNGVSGNASSAKPGPSALNHPNFCTIHDIGPNYLVMEFVEDKLPRGPMPADQVLGLAMQLADALTAAHERGIVQRDLKPGNILVTENKVMLLDFGLAKMAPQVGSGA